MLKKDVTVKNLNVKKNTVNVTVSIKNVLSYVNVKIA